MHRIWTKTKFRLLWFFIPSKLTGFQAALLGFTTQPSSETIRKAAWKAIAGFQAAFLAADNLSDGLYFSLAILSIQSNSSFKS